MHPLWNYFFPVLLGTRCVNCYFGTSNNVFSTRTKWGPKFVNKFMKLKARSNVLKFHGSFKKDPWFFSNAWNPTNLTVQWYVPCSIQLLVTKAFPIFAAKTAPKASATSGLLFQWRSNYSIGSLSHQSNVLRNFDGNYVKIHHYSHDCRFSKNHPDVSNVLHWF